MKAIIILMVVMQSVVMLSVIMRTVFAPYRKRHIVDLNQFQVSVFDQSPVL